MSQTLISNIVLYKLDPKELIQLLPKEERPLRKAAACSNLQFDNQMGTFTTIDEPYTTFKKDLPSLRYLIYTLLIYDIIFLHIKWIIYDFLIHNYDWYLIV